MEPNLDCVDVAEARSRDEPLLMGPLAAHAEGCPVCRSGAPGGHASPAPGPAPAGDAPHLAAMLTQLDGDLDAESNLTGRLRALPTRARVLIGAAAVLAVVGAVMTMHGETQAVWSSPRGLLAVTTFAIGLAVALRLALRPLHEPSPSEAFVRAVLAATLGLPVGLALVPSAGPDPVVPFVSAAGTCLGLGAVLGLCVVGVLRALDRGGHASPRMAFVAAAVGGLAANLALELHCPIHAPTHLLAGHASIGFALALAYGGIALRRA